MSDLFGFTFFLSFLGLIVGVISPAPFSKLFKRSFSRKQVLAWFGSLTVASFFLFGITTPTITTKDEPSNLNPKTENVRTDEALENHENEPEDADFPEAPVALEQQGDEEIETPQQIKKSETLEQVPTPIIPVPEPSPTPLAAPNGTYTNVYGNEVPSPYQAPSKPDGASARCRDGTYSFSQSRRGTCSHHGGVAEWY